MALDTARKRASAQHVGSPWRPGVIVPTSLDQGERQSVSFMYAGILAGTATPAVATEIVFTFTGPASSARNLNTLELQLGQRENSGTLTSHATRRRGGQTLNVGRRMGQT